MVAVMAAVTGNTSSNLLSVVGANNSTTAEPTHDDGNAEAIRGAIIGSVVGVVILLLVCIICCSCRKKRSRGHRPMDPAPARAPRGNVNWRGRLRSGRERLSQLLPFNRRTNDSGGSSSSTVPIGGGKSAEPDVEQQQQHHYQQQQQHQQQHQQQQQDQGHPIAPASRSHNYDNHCLVMENDGVTQTQSKTHAYINQPNGQEGAAQTKAQSEPGYVNINCHNMHHQDSLDNRILAPDNPSADHSYINVGHDGQPTGVQSQGSTEGEYITGTLTGSDDEADYINGDFDPEDAEDKDKRGSDTPSYQNILFGEGDHYENAQVGHEQKLDHGYIPHTSPIAGAAPAAQHPRPPITSTKPRLPRPRQQ